MRILVTGSKGQVGHCLVQQLNGLGCEYLAIDRDELDITHQAEVEKFVVDFAPDVIINAAAHTAVDKAEEEVELSYAINRDGPKFLAEAANKVGAGLLHISTDYVYDGIKEGSYTEDDATNPQGVYGASKLAGEQEVLAKCEKAIVLRTAWVFGEHGNNFVKTMLRLGKDRDTLGIVSDQFGGPTYAGDIAGTLIKIAQDIVAEKGVNYGIYHFTGEPHVSWHEFASFIFDTANEQKVIPKVPALNKLTTEEYPTPAKRPANSKLNTDKIRTEFGIKPSDWQSALQNLSLYTS